MDYRHSPDTKTVLRTGFARAAMLAGLGFLVWCGTDRAALAQQEKVGATVRLKPEQLHQLEIKPAELGAYTTMRAAIGQIAFNEDASTVVLAPFSGRVTRLIAKVGDDVKRGDPLFELDSSEVVQAQTDLIAAVQTLEKANAQMALAKRVMDRQNALLTDRATAMREVEQARNDHAAAQSDVATAQGGLTAARNRLRIIVGRNEAEIARVERERIVNPLITVNAPIDGTVIARKVGPGQYVRSDAGDTLYAIADLSTMWLKAFVPEADIAFIRPGQDIEVKVTAIPNRTFKARIIAIGASSDQQTRRIVVRSEIPNPDRTLKAEMFATFKIATADPVVAPRVPAEAVIREGSAASIYVQSEPMLFQRRAVELGSESGGLIQIRHGLEPGEQVIGRGAIFVDNELKQ